ncbi:MAG: BatD family protein [Taibaiella sp.]|nr:BatD family protein [Taibaiella sp.]
MSYFFISIVTIWANPKISTHVNAKKIGLNDVLSVTYSATEIGSIVDQEVPQFKDFIQVGISQSSNSDGEYAITVHLRPTRTGTYTIPGIVIYTSDGKSLTSNPVSVQVVKGSTDPSANGSVKAPSLSRDPVDIFQQMGRSAHTDAIAFPTGAGKDLPGQCQSFENMTAKN